MYVTALVFTGCNAKSSATKKENSILSSLYVYKIIFRVNTNIKIDINICKIRLNRN